MGNETVDATYSPIRPNQIHLIPPDCRALTKPNVFSDEYLEFLINLRPKSTPIVAQPEIVFSEMTFCLHESKNRRIASKLSHLARVLTQCEQQSEAATMNVPIKTLAVAAVLVSAGPGHSAQLDIATTLARQLKDYSPAPFAEQTSASLNHASVKSSKYVLPQLARHRKSEQGAYPVSFAKITHNVATRSGIGVRHPFGRKLSNGSVVMHANAGDGL